MNAITNDTYYPTPVELIDRMLAKIQGHPKLVLEPSAGKGAIIERMKKYYRQIDFGEEYEYRYRYRNFHPFDECDVRAIEIDTEFQSVLRGNGVKVVDGDFLAFSGPDKFDLIIANPPFDHGDLHLLKAIDILYCGEIVFLLNAETIKNPHTFTRQELAKKLSELNADIEFIPNAFKNAERPTEVEVALVYIKISRKAEDDLFAGCKDQISEEPQPELKQNYEVSTGKTIAELVAEYNQIIRVGTETIISYFQNYPKVWRYIGLNKEVDKYIVKPGELTTRMQNAINDLLKTVRIDFWRRTLEIPDVTKRMTESKRNAFHRQVQDQCNMDFTENNIRQFILNLIDGYEDMMMDCVLKVFKYLTSYAWSDGLYDENIHYFNGWKTNNAFRVNKKVILSCFSPFSFVDQYSNSKKWKLGYTDPLKETRDIDTVMNYFDAMGNYRSIECVVKDALDDQVSKKIRSTYFTIDVFKKGTIHLTFNDDDIWRRFNVAACVGKNWLPHDYGSKPYAECSQEEKSVINSFEGAASYDQHLRLPIFVKKNVLQLAA